MIISGKKSTIIAGEASLVMTEVAAIVDRMLTDINKKTSEVGQEMNYDIMVDKFIKLVFAAQELREKDPDLHPQAMIDAGMLTKIFNEEFFNLVPKSEVKKRDSDTKESENTSEKAKIVSDMLAEAMRKHKEQMEPKEPKEPKKKKKKKKVKEDKKGQKKSSKKDI